MPDAVGDLETEIDRIAGTQNWIKETPETLPALLAEHWNFKANTEENAALFANVIAQGSPELISQFMKGGAPALTITKSRLGTRSALEGAALKGNLDLVRQMLKGQDNLPEAVLFQALRAGAQSGNLDLVRFLIEQGADVNGKPADPQDQQTVLMSAVQSAKPEVVEEILLHNPDVNAKYYGGFTALTMFLQNGGNQAGAGDILKALIAHGANVSLRDEQGTTPIFHACMMPSAVGILVGAGADPNARDNSGQTALLRCVYNKDFVAALLQAGADPSIADRYGRTPLDAARSMSSKDSAALLEAALKGKAAP
jgi:cytohesin